MKRREFITLIGGAAAAWPLVSRAQQPTLPVIGFLRSTSFANATELTTAFREGLKEAGFVEGQNVAIEFSSAEDHTERLPALVADLIHRPVAVIVGNSISVRVAKAATTTIPIVFTFGGDPVKEGLVASLNRPGGNVTGVTFFNDVLGSKRLELLHQLAPKAKVIAVLIYPGNLNTVAERMDMVAGAQSIGLQLVILDAGSDREIELAFTTFIQRGAGALLVGTGAYLRGHRERIVALATRHALPTSYVWREAVLAGGLMSYAPSITNAFRQAGIYTGRVLKGEKPAELPVMQSTKFEFVINLKTAKALGLDVPQPLLIAADEVIE
jgi:putative ABC transport system substrate-binding protein